jgi:hypothetical protein
MAAVVNHQAISFSSGSALNLTFAQTAGNALVVFAAINTNTTLSVADSSNGTYTQVGTTQIGGVTCGIWVFFGIAAAASGVNTVGVTSGGFNGPIAVVEVSGLSGVTDGYNGNGNFTTAISSGSLTTTNANDVVLGFFGVGNNFVSYGSGWLGLDGTVNVASEYQIVSATGSYTATFTTTGSNNWASAIAAFKITASGTTQKITATIAASAAMGGAVKKLQKLSITI